MKKINLGLITLFSALVLNADVLPESKGIGTRGTGVGTRGTGLEQDENGIGTRGTGFETDENGIGTRGTGIGSSGKGIGTRGTGFGTRGTGFDVDNNGFGTRGTTDRPTTANDILDLQISQIGAVPYRKIYQNEALVLKVVMTNYLSSMQKSFDNDPYAKRLAPLNFQAWASVNAGELIVLFETTKWNLIEDPNLDLPQVSFDHIKDEGVIEVINSSQGFDQRIASGMITKALSEFFLYAGAPFSYNEIYFQLLPFEKEIVDSTKSSDFN